MLPRRPGRRTFALAGISSALAVLLLLAAVRLERQARAMSDLEREVRTLRQAQGAASGPGADAASPLLFDYRLELPGRGEVFPAMAATQAPEYWPVATLRVASRAQRTVSQTITAEIPGFSRRSEQSVVLAPRETRRLDVRPELLARAHENAEIRHATLEVRAFGPDGAVLFAESRPVLIHGGSEIYWGRRFVNAPVAARWVTPHEPAVLELVSRARRFARRGRMAGYDRAAGARAAAAHVEEQARAVFRALQSSGLSYVNSLRVMGEHVNEAQRIRLPRETLRLANANCMDLSVAFASAMENLGLEPVLVIVPGHAFVGVRLERGSTRVLYLDLTVLPAGGFDAAVARARRLLDRQRSSQVLTVDVVATRALGVYPLAEGPPQEPAVRIASASQDRRPAGTVLADGRGAQPRPGAGWAD